MSDPFEGLKQRDNWASAQIDDYRETGNLELRDEVFQSYSPLAKITAARIAHPAEEHEDIIQEARIGLFKAIEEWDAQRGASFSTWVIAKMRYACVEYARNAIWGTRSMQDKLKKALRRVTEIDSGEPMTDEEIENGGPVMPAHYLLCPLSLDDRLREHEGDDCMLYLRDTITDAINCEFAAIQNILQAEVQAGLRWLPEREEHVFRLYYYEGKTFKEIGAILKVSESRVFQIHQQGMRRMKVRLKGMEDEELPPYPYTATEDRANGKLRRTRTHARDKIAA